MAFPCFPNTSSSDLLSIPTQSMPQSEAVMVSFSGVTYLTQSTTTSSIFTQYVEQEPPLWLPSLPQFQLMRNPTAQSLVGLGPPVTGNYTAYPEQQQSSITPRTPRAERQTNGKYIELSNFPSEEGVIDGLLPSDKNYPTPQPLVGLGPPVTGNYTPEPHIPAVITNNPEQQHSSITPRTPRAERQTNEKHINLSIFSSEEDAIDELLPSDENYPTAQPLVGLGPPVTAYIELSNFPSEEGAIDELLPSDENYPTAQPLVGLGPPVTAYIELSNFPSEEGAIDELLPIDERYQTTLSPADLKKAVSAKYTTEPHLPAEIINKYIPPQTKKPTRKKRIHLTDNDKAELMQKIRAGDKEDAELAEEYNVSVNRVQYYRRNTGLLLRAPKKKEKVLSGEEKYNLNQDLCMDERLSDDELQKKYNISSTTLRRVKKSAGLDTKNTKKNHKGRTRLTMDDEMKLIDDLRKTGTARLSNASLAKKYNIGASTVKRRAKKYQLQPKRYLRGVSDNFRKYFQQLN